MKSTRKITSPGFSIPNRRDPRSNSVSSGRAARRSMISPNAVSRPDANTTAVAVPLTTDVPRNTSRVNPASPLMRILRRRTSQLERIHRSAPLAGRADRPRSQPGIGRHQIAGAESDDVAHDDVRRGRSTHRPSRRTVAVGATCCRSRETARCDRNVCQALIPPLRSTMPPMIAASVTSPRIADARPAISRMTTSGLLNLESARGSPNGACLAEFVRPID